jgi:hypothetical protein
MYAPRTQFAGARYYALGIGFLALARGAHLVRGYTARPFSDPVQAVNYDVHIAEFFRAQCAAAGIELRGKRILELGPGPTPGVALALLQAGASSYTSFDRYPAPPRLSQEYLLRLQTLGIPTAPLFESGPITRVVRKDFDLSAVSGRFDVILSNAAFEHFSDVRRTLHQLTEIAAPAANLIASIDLQTHTRWIREKDPLNIYRYPNWLYRLFRFAGQPNRVRPVQYKGWLQDFGWTQIEMAPSTQTAVFAHVQERFRDDELGWLSFVLRARKPFL